ncbi:uncharacterized protein LOC142728938 isoform X5 [Rhinoderma darwinii]|uniref:uncharacterized protein LOC142699158 isoform X3 n=1 Tax=Rhinoderma darwinii TaxID=43563 RepID=UPI003F6749E8
MGQLGKDSAPTGQHAGLPCYVIAIETVRFPTIVERTTNRQLKAPPNVLMSLLYGQIVPETQLWILEPENSHGWLKMTPQPQVLAVREILGSHRTPSKAL